MKTPETTVVQNGSHKQHLETHTKPSASFAMSRTANLLRRNVSMETLKPLYKRITKPSVSVKEPCPQPRHTVGEVKASHRRPMFQDFKLLSETSTASSESDDRNLLPGDTGKQITAGTQAGAGVAGHIEQSPEKVELASEAVTQVRGQTTSSRANEVGGEPTLLSPPYHNKRPDDSVNRGQDSDGKVLNDAASPPLHGPSQSISPAMGPHAKDARPLRLRGNVVSVNSPNIIPGATNPDGTPRANPFHELMPAPPIWHRNMPPYCPFGETPFMEKVMSDQINRDLKNAHGGDTRPDGDQVRSDASDGEPRPSDSIPSAVVNETLPQQARPRAVPNGPRKTHVFRSPWILPRLSTHVLQVLLADPETPERSPKSASRSKRPAPPEVDEGRNESNARDAVRRKR